MTSRTSADRQAHGVLATAVAQDSGIREQHEMLSEGTVRLVTVFFFQAEDGIRDYKVTGVQTCALPIFSDVTVRSSRATVVVIERNRGNCYAGNRKKRNCQQKPPRADPHGNRHPVFSPRDRKSVV